MTGAKDPTTVSTGIQQIAELARKRPNGPLFTLAHRIDVEWLKEAYRQTRKGGATGVDDEGSAAFAENLQDNLLSLIERFKSGTYRAPPVRRKYIPKADGTQRPIGIPTFEDKVLQRAVVMLLEPIYEQEFYGCSYGFRRGRSAHQALEHVRDVLRSMDGGTVLELDIRSFFDSVDHQHLRSFLDRRVTDGVIRRAIDKWLKAGVMEDGAVTLSDEGTPQGGVISPMLANIFLHEVLDKWFHDEVKPRMKGRAELIRYADDAVLLFSLEEDARRVAAVLPRRFDKFGLQLHPDKTRLVKFKSPSSNRHDDDDGPGTFDFLGFTHAWTIARSGRWTIKQLTAKSRISRTLTRIREWCRKHMHDPVRTQWETLNQKLRGHYGYFGVIGNYERLHRIQQKVRRIWRRALRRRSQRSRMTTQRFAELETVFPLLRPRITRRRQSANACA